MREREREWRWRDEERVSYRRYGSRGSGDTGGFKHGGTGFVDPRLGEAVEQMKVALQQMINDARTAMKIHTAQKGILLSAQRDSYMYQCTLTSKWDVQEHTRLFIHTGTSEQPEEGVITNIVSVEAASVTFVTTQQIPDYVLEHFTLHEDTTWLLERQLDALQFHYHETEGQLGAKVLGYIPVTYRVCQTLDSVGSFVPNAQQQKAIAQAMGSEFTMLIGPGGTGKSATIASLTNLFLKKGYSVLVVSHTNIATDNVFLRQLQAIEQSGEKELLHLLAEGRIVRVGKSHHPGLLQGKYRQMTVDVLAAQHMSYDEAHGDVRQRHQDRAEKKAEIIAQAQLVAATTSSVFCNPSIMQKDFDVVIIDEVSMLSLVHVLLTVSLARKQVVVAGDPMQLAPILKTVCPEWKRASEMPEAVKWLGQNLFTHLGVTIFDAIHGEKGCVLLTEQGRMNPHILAPLNHFIYQDMLTSRPETVYAPPVAPLPSCPLMLVDTSSSKDS